MEGVQAIEYSWFLKKLRPLGVLLYLIPSPLFSMSSIELKNIYNNWGISVVQENKRNKFESASAVAQTANSKSSHVLELRLWHETPQIRAGVAPSPTIYCKMAYNLVFGRARNHGDGVQNSLTSFFKNHSNFDSVKLIYFLVVYNNKPIASSEPRPHVEERVQWKREEKIIPYLSLEIDRQTWNDISTVLKIRQWVPYSTFESAACPGIFNSNAQFKTDFENLKSMRLSELH
jgi:hypothetical protein